MAAVRHRHPAAIVESVSLSMKSTIVKSVTGARVRSSMPVINRTPRGTIQSPRIQ